MAKVTIKGMSCQHCVASVKEALEKIPGIKSVDVNLDKGEANYKGEASQDSVEAAIKKIGFEVVP